MNIRFVFFSFLLLSTVGSISAQRFSVNDKYGEISGNHIMISDAYGLEIDDDFIHQMTFGYDTYHNDNNQIIIIKNKYWIFLYLNGEEYFHGNLLYDPIKWIDQYIFVAFSQLDASNFLTETILGEEVTYHPSNLLDYNLETLWVCNNENGGVGEKLTMDSGGISFDKIAIINGFFDPKHLYLYVENSRVKRIRVNSENHSPVDYTLLDSANPQIIELPYSTQEIEIEIIEVYSGNRFSDCAISGIYYIDNDLLSFYPE